MENKPTYEELEQQIKELKEANLGGRNAETALLESEERFRIFIDNSYDAVMIHEPDGRLIDVNKTMLKMYDLSYDEALTYDVADYSGPISSPKEAQSH